MSGQPWDTPAMRREGDDFTYLWKPLGVGIGVSGLYEGDHGQVHGEITVVSVHPTTGMRNGMIEFCTMNLCVQQTRKSLANALNTREGMLLDWDKALRYVTYDTVQKYRTGDPAVDLSKVVIDRSRSHLVERILPDRQVAIFYGDGMAGKSMVAAILAIAVQTGRPVGQLFIPTRQANVLYLDWETQADEQADRIEQLSRGLGLDRPPIMYRQPRRLLADDMTLVRQEVAKHNIGLVIVDSMHLAAGNVVDFDAVGRFNSALTSLKETSKIVVTHVSKATAQQETGKGSPLGLAQVNNYGRSNWEFRAERNDREGYINVGMFHRKVNNGRLQDPLAFRFTFDTDYEGPYISVQTTDLLDSPGLVAHSTNADRIRSALREDDLSTKDLAERLNISEGVLRVLIGRMPEITQQGLVQTGQKGNPMKVWHLNGKATEPF